MLISENVLRLIYKNKNWIWFRAGVQSNPIFMSFWHLLMCIIIKIFTFWFFTPALLPLRKFLCSILLFPLEKFRTMSRQLVGFLNTKKTLFLLCDVQEKFRPAIKNFDAMVKNTQKLVSRKNSSAIMSLSSYDAIVFFTLGKYCRLVLEKALTYL